MDKINKIAIHKHPYLQSTADIDGMPQTLFYIGRLPATRQPTVAIVGSRKPTSYGREVTYEIAHQLARRGVVIVSGLALGIDAVAHQAALDAGGTTIAVLANGLDQITPRSNRQLGIDIVASGGAIVSEYSVGIEPLLHHFLARNRIVSGLADILVITEAASRSGTLNTASHALSQGKDVCVVPGNITSAMSAGCNNLLKQGAAPVTAVEDVLAMLDLDEKTSQVPLPLGDTGLEQQIIDAIASGLRDGGEIMATIDSISAAEFNTVLTLLEIKGDIKPLGDNKWGLS